MSSILLPSTRIAQPVGLEAIRLEGLRAAYFGNSRNNFARHGESAIYFNGTVVGANGRAAIGTDSYIAMWVGNPGVSVPAGGDFTFVFATPKAEMLGTNPGLMRSDSGVLASGTVGGGNNFFIFQGSGSNRPWIRLNSTDILKPTSGEQLFVGDAHVIAYSVRSGKTATVAWGGAVRHASTHAVSSPAFSYSYVGAQSSLPERVGNLSAFLHFDRAFSDVELEKITGSSLTLRPQSRRIWFDMGAAGGGASTGTLSATQSGDSLTGAAQLVLSATLSAAQDSNTLTGQAALALSGALSIAQASDSLAANGTVASTAITGTLTAAQGANTLSAQGALPIIGTLSASQASNTITTQGVLAIGASLSATQSVNTITAQAALALSGTLSATQVSDTLIANGTSTHSGDLSVTQTGNTLSGLGALSLSGYLAATQADNTLSASAVLAIVGSMSTAQAADVLIATGARDLFGTLAAVQADQALTATGTSVAGLTDSQKIDLILKILSDRQTLDPTTGLYTLYDTDATTVLYTASAWEDTGGTIPYRGQQLQRLDPLT